MVKVKTEPFIYSCWAKCILGSQSGAQHQTVRLKPESPFVEANVTMSHRPASLHRSVSLVTCSALQLCNSRVCVCCPAFYFSQFECHPLSLSPSPSSCPPFCRSDHSPLKHLLFPTLHAAQQFSERSGRNVAPLFRRCLFYFFILFRQTSFSPSWIIVLSCIPFF